MVQSSCFERSHIWGDRNQTSPRYAKPPKIKMLRSLLCGILVTIGWVSAQHHENMKFDMPQPDEEEQNSIVLPPRYKCDACRAVAHQWELAFRVEGARRGGRAGTSNPLKEWRYTEIIDDVCVGHLDDYGIKQTDDAPKEKMLSGPGLPGAERPGTTLGGGKWPWRLRTGEYDCSSFFFCQNI